MAMLTQRAFLVQALVQPVLVVGVLELPKRVPEVALVPDERAVQEVMPARLQPAFSIRSRSRHDVPRSVYRTWNSCTWRRPQAEIRGLGRGSGAGRTSYGRMYCRRQARFQYLRLLGRATHSRSNSCRHSEVPSPALVHHPWPLPTRPHVERRPKSRKPPRQRSSPRRRPGPGRVHSDPPGGEASAAQRPRSDARRLRLAPTERVHDNESSAASRCYQDFPGDPARLDDVQPAADNAGLASPQFSGWRSDLRASFQRPRPEGRRPYA